MASRAALPCRPREFARLGQPAQQCGRSRSEGWQPAAGGAGAAIAVAPNPVPGASRRRPVDDAMRVARSRAPQFSAN